MMMNNLKSFIAAAVLFFSALTFGMTAKEAMDKGNESEDIKESLSWYKKALEICPESDKKFRGWILNNIGYSYIRLNKWDDALASLEKAVEANPKIEHAWNNLGIVYENMSYIKKDSSFLTKAKDCYEKAVKLRPDMEKFKLNMKRAENLITKQ
jgi:tetratricopeptide (TPR) repeat protein